LGLTYVCSSSALTTRNARKNKAYSPPGIAVSPLASSSEAQICCPLVNVDELTRVLIDACCTQLSRINCRSTGQTSTKLIWDVPVRHSFKQYRHFNRPTRLEMPARRMKIVGWFSPNNRAKVCVIVDVNALMQTTILNFVSERMSTDWRHRDDTKRVGYTEKTSVVPQGGQFRSLQKAIKWIAYHSNVPWTISKQTSD